MTIFPNIMGQPKRLIDLLEGPKIWGPRRAPCVPTGKRATAWST